MLAQLPTRNSFDKEVADALDRLGAPASYFAHRDAYALLPVELTSRVVSQIIKEFGFYTQSTRLGVWVFRCGVYWNWKTETSSWVADEFPDTRTAACWRLVEPPDPTMVPQEIDSEAATPRTLWDALKD